MWAKRKDSGFTIVELLIVIVVIAILAAITIVAYNGIQQRARDAERSTEISAIQKALEMYHADTGGYPKCSGGTGANLSPYPLTSGTAHGCLDELVPNYISVIPTDPTGANPYQYWYAVGYKKDTATSFSANNTDNYILGARLETKTTDFTSNGWGQTLNVLMGSSN